MKLARQANRCDQWLIFCQANEVNDVWSVAARATINNELGHAAKVSPDDGDARRARVICIYTNDFTDLDDIARVVRKLKDLGLVDTRGKPIWYKCGQSISNAHPSLPLTSETDAYTYLGLGSGNPYEIRPTMYSSAEMLKPKEQWAKHEKIEGAFYRKQKGEGDWQPLEWE